MIEKIELTEYLELPVIEDINTNPKIDIAQEEQSHD